MSNPIFSEFPDDSRVWLYQTNRPLDDDEINLINNKLSVFIKDWAAHGNQLWGNAKVLNPYFVAVTVNDKLTPPSGCSIDASVKKIQELGKLIEVDFFTRMKMTIKDSEGNIEQVDFSNISNLKGENIEIFDPLVQNLETLRKKWPCSIAESSLSSLV